jgi:hypothetical protein
MGLMNCVTCRIFDGMLDIRRVTILTLALRNRLRRKRDNVRLERFWEYADDRRDFNNIHRVSQIQSLILLIPAYETTINGVG